MPTYDYRCQNGHDSEHFFRKISDGQAEMACPVCGAEAVRRMSGGAGLVFKGSGFYLTDYGKNAHRKSGDSAKSDGKTEGKAEGKSEGKAESKSEGATSGSSGTSSDAGGSGSASKAESSKPSEKVSSTKSTGGDAK